MKLKIVTWNINSIRLREDHVCSLLAKYKPDIICLQELKAPTESVPISRLEELGYKYRVIRGQKSYNGVAIISRIPLSDADYCDYCLKGDARHVSARLSNGVEIQNFYIPAGGDIPNREENKKFAHKLDFLNEMKINFIKKRLSKTILVGDLNIAPLEHDVWSHSQLLKVVSHTPIEIEALQKVAEAGNFIDITRKNIPDGLLYSWWSYRSPNWSMSNRGRRLDHIWATSDIAMKAHSSFILKEARSWERPSDHVPVFAEFNL
ncbi:MAG: exodeoxyribonuclease III [Paracoccaceae bacterium]|nr:exodeoxyribonuclease III [Paracoccaceae bacterium]